MLRNRRLRLRFVAILLTLVGLTAGTVRIRARSGVIQVDTTDDELTPDGDCSLREAIRAANEDSAVDACPAGGGHDVIVLPAGTYTLSIPGSGENLALTGDLDVTDDVDLQGRGPSRTIVDGGALDRVFEVVGPIDVQISGLTVRNGSAGGLAGGAGIYNRADGTLKLTDSALSQNRATLRGGGIRNLGTLEVSSTTFDGNAAERGAGLDNGGTLRAEGSTLKGGSAGEFGGGIYNVGHATLTNLTVSGNEAASNGGGIFNGLTSSAITLTNSTVARNLSDGAGGIRNLNGHVTLQNTIVADNGGQDCSAIRDLASQGHNLDSDDTCHLDGPGDLPGADPRLGPLGDNGGPTLTHALLPGGPAVDAGADDACPAVDQRGVERPLDGDLDGQPRCDVGAYEFEPALLYLPFAVLQ